MKTRTSLGPTVVTSRCSNTVSLQFALLHLKSYCHFYYEKANFHLDSDGHLVQREHWDDKEVTAVHQVKGDEWIAVIRHYILIKTNHFVKYHGDNYYDNRQLRAAPFAAFVATSVSSCLSTAPSQEAADS